MLCSGLVDAGGAHRLIAGDTLNLVFSLSLSTPHHVHTLVTYAHINTTIQYNGIRRAYKKNKPGITRHVP